MHTTQTGQQIHRRRLMNAIINVSIFCWTVLIPNNNGELTMMTFILPLHNRGDHTDHSLHSLVTWSRTRLAPAQDPGWGGWCAEPAPARQDGSSWEEHSWHPTDNNYNHSLKYRIVQYNKCNDCANKYELISIKD